MRLAALVLAVPALAAGGAAPSRRPRTSARGAHGDLLASGDVLVVGGCTVTGASSTSEARRPRSSPRDAAVRPGLRSGARATATEQSGCATARCSSSAAGPAASQPRAPSAGGRRGSLRGCPADAHAARRFTVTKLRGRTYPRHRRHRRHSHASAAPSSSTRLVAVSSQPARCALPARPTRRRFSRTASPRRGRQRRGEGRARSVEIWSPHRPLHAGRSAWRVTGTSGRRTRSCSSSAGERSDFAGRRTSAELYQALRRWSSLLSAPRFKLGERRRAARRRRAGRSSSARSLRPACAASDAGAARTLLCTARASDGDARRGGHDDRIARRRRLAALRAELDAPRSSAAQSSSLGRLATSPDTRLSSDRYAPQAADAARG